MSTHLRSLQEFTKEELEQFVNRALELKKERAEGVNHQQLAGKTVGLIFEKPSTRTRVSFESAMYGLGGQVIFLSGRDTQLARSEPLKDMARVMSRYVDGMVVRTFGQNVVDELAERGIAVRPVAVVVPRAGRGLAVGELAGRAAPPAGELVPPRSVVLFFGAESKAEIFA